MKSLLLYHLYVLDWPRDWDILLQLHHFSFPRIHQNGHALYVSLNNSRAKRSHRNYLSLRLQYFTMKKFRLRSLKSGVTNANIYMI